MRKENLLKVFILLINLIVAIRLFDIGILKHEHYKNESNSILNNYVPVILATWKAEAGG